MKESGDTIILQRIKRQKSDYILKINSFVTRSWKAPQPLYYIKELKKIVAAPVCGEEKKTRCRIEMYLILVDPNMFHYKLRQGIYYKL